MRETHADEASMVKKRTKKARDVTAKTRPKRAASPQTGASLARSVATPLREVGGVAAGVAGISTGANAHNLMWFAAFGVLGTTLSVLAPLALQAFAPTAQRFGDRLAKRLVPRVPGPKKAEALAQVVQSSRHSSRAVLEGVRRLLEAGCDEVTEPLADLTAEYCDKPIDRFFRGVARLLSELSAEELDALRDILGMVNEVKDKLTDGERVGVDLNGPSFELVVRLSGSLPGNSETHKTLRSPRDVESAEHVVRLLTISDLARTTIGAAVSLRGRDLKRLGRLVGVSFGDDIPSADASNRQSR